MLVVSRTDVEAVMDLDALRAAVASAMVDVSAGRASMPARIAARVEERDGLLAAMPAYLPGLPALAAKLVSVFPQNAGKAKPSHQAVILVFDSEDGSPLALLDGTYITAARTAAGSALSVDLLARLDAHTLAILGTGVQAQSHADAVVRVRDFDEIRIAGRDHDKAKRLAAELSSRLDRVVRAADSNEQACEDADVVCACTHSPEPVVLSRYIANGTHVTSVGYNIAGREVDSGTVARSILVVESRNAVLAAPPSGSNDIRVPIEEGLISAAHIHAELGEIAAGSRPGRTSDEQVTLYKSVGVAAQDVAAATLVLDAAKRAGRGHEVSL